MKNDMNVTLVWNEQRRRERFDKIQVFVDSSCIRYMAQYTPMRTGMLMKSATLGTKIGIGHIVYNSPYARYQYYGIIFGPNIPITENGQVVGFWSPPKKHSTGRQMSYSKARHPNATRLWFEVMKKKHKPAIQRGIAALERGGTNEHN